MKNDEKVTQSRRNLLKAITAGGAAAAVVPAEWAKPLVKATVLPAHAQATVNGECSLSQAFASARGGQASSFYMSVSASAASTCGDTASVNVYDNEGNNIAQCTKSAGDGTPGNEIISWSCSASYEPAPSSGTDFGDEVTFVVSFENGCSCSIVREAS